jgi:hypothetical protein
MSRETYEVSKAAWMDEMFGKGPTDPDVLGYYPGSPEDPHMQEREEVDAY